jgi:endonuclease/exonuclease/phosphatase family metal-dependent hydrolase
MELMRPIPAMASSLERPLFRTLTFNAGLAPGIVPFATQRIALVAEAVAYSDFDLVCLQEVWTKEARDAIVAALALPPENVYYVETEGEGETGKDRCADGEIDDILACAQKNCGSEPAEEFTACAARKCLASGIQLYLHSRSCLNCLTACAGKSASEVVETCTGAGAGASRTYGGRNGIILASRWPLIDKGVEHLPSSGANRVALMARVEVPGHGSVEVACTHLSSRNDVSPTHPAFSDWSDEQRAQIELISEKLKFRSEGRPELLIGDMNFGQRNDPVNAALMWSSWKLTADLGFVSPVEYAEPAFCSCCDSNYLNVSKSNILIDHALVRNPPKGGGLEPLQAFRVFDQTVSILDWTSQQVQTNMSDHYGVVVDFDLH